MMDEKQVSEAAVLHHARSIEKFGGADMDDGTELCDETCVHHGVVESVTEQMPDDDALYELAELFKMFGDSTRVRILYALFEKEMCVCDIAELLHMTQSAISHQLRALKQGRLVRCRRDGKTVYYALADRHVISIINEGMEHVLE